MCEDRAWRAVEVASSVDLSVLNAIWWLSKLTETLSLMCWRTSFSKHFIRMGVSATGWKSFRLDRYNGTGTKVTVLQQMGTLSCDSEMLKMSVMTSAGWHKFLVDSQGCYQQNSSHSCCGYWQWPVLWRQSRLDSWLFVEKIKASIKCVKLIWQHGLTHDGGTTAFVACDGLNLRSWCRPKQS